MKLFIKDRKGQLSMSFNWIFVLIIGAVLLGFFFTAISSGSKSSEQKISISLTKHFETIIFSSGQKPGVLKTYVTPEVELSFFCNDNEGFYNYMVGDLKARDTKYDILFTPKTLLGDSIITWTQSWQMPYTVATVMYITNKDHMFVFEKTGDPAPRHFTDLVENFANNVTTYIIDEDHSASSVPKGYDHYTYVLFNDSSILSSQFIQESSDTLVDIVFVNPALNDVFAYGDVFFLKPENMNSFNLNRFDLVSDDDPTVNIGISLEELGEELTFNSRISPGFLKGQSAYIGGASLYGAIFSGSQNLYECNMNKARHRLFLQTTLQINKLEIIGPAVSSNCRQLLGLDPSLPGPKGTLLEIENMVEGDSFPFRKIPQLKSWGVTLQNQNDELSISGTCPTVY